MINQRIGYQVNYKRQLRPHIQSYFELKRRTNLVMNTK